MAAQAPRLSRVHGTVQAGPIVYFERFSRIHSAIAREKQIKGYTRLKKMALIVAQNPTWKDLSEAWYVKHRFEPDRAA